MLAIGCLFTVSCSDDNGEYIDLHQLEIKSAETSIEARGGSAVIETAASAVSAEAAASWLNVSVSGSNVTVSAEANPSIQSRHTTVTIKDQNGNSAIVNVSQYGMVFSLDSTSPLVVGDDAKTYKYAMSSNAEVLLSTTADWINAKVATDSLELSVSANNQGHVRKGYVYYTVAGTTDSIEVVQGDFDKDIAGTYYMLYLPSDTATKASYSLTTVTRDSIVINALKLSIPTSYDDETLTFTMKAGQFVGMYSKYYIFNPFILEDGYWTAYNAGATVTAPVSYDDKEAATVFSFAGKVGSRNYVGFYLEAFTSKNLSEDADFAELAAFYSPEFYKFDEESAKKNFAAKAKRANLSYVLRK